MEIYNNIKYKKRYNKNLEKNKKLNTVFAVNTNQKKY